TPASAVPIVGKPTTTKEEHRADPESYDWPDTRLIRWSKSVNTRIRSWLLSSYPADWALVVISGFGVWAALRTLRSIEEQTAANVREAEAAKLSAKTAAVALRLAHRPYFDVKELKVSDTLKDPWPIDDPRQPKFRLSLSYRVYNASQT